jgi:hypothetical protein
MRAMATADPLICFAGIAALLILASCGCRSEPSPKPVATPVAPAPPPTPTLVVEESQPAAPPKDSGEDERNKIERLLEALKTSDAVFIRNGVDYSGADAAAHLRRKWNSAGDKIKTAQQFIDELASKSSSSGKPYQIRRADGTIVDSQGWFEALLSTIEAKQTGAKPISERL